MGDPKKPRKKYSTPMHPWQSARIEEEKQLVKEYGLKNKKEIWQMKSILKGFFAQVKDSVVAKGKQAEKEKEQFMKKLQSLGLIKKTSKTDDVLGLTINDIMERRLQTFILRKGFARSIKQARQFITHGHILVGGKKIKSPSYLVRAEEENQVNFVPTSELSDSDHPEREIKKPEKVPKKEKSPEKPKRKPKEKYKEKPKEKPKEEKAEVKDENSE